MKKTLFLTMTLLVVLTGILSISAVAQQTETVTAKKSGSIHFGKAVQVGDKTLEAGMYQVQHADENGEHFVIFRTVEMGYRSNMGNQKLGTEAARVPCTVEAVDKKISSTKVWIRQNAAGERVAFEVWIRGEKVKHILPAR